MGCKNRKSPEEGKSDPMALLFRTFHGFPSLGKKKAQYPCKGPWFPSALCPSFLSHLNFFPLLLIPSIPATLNLLLFIGQPKHMSASGPLHKLLPVLGTVFIHLHKTPAFRSDLCSNAVLSIRFSLTMFYKPAASTISQWSLLLPVSWSPVGFFFFFSQSTYKHLTLNAFVDLLMVCPPPLKGKLH